MVELFSLVMVPKERVKDFNQRFTYIINKFKEVLDLSQEIQMEVYANSMLASISVYIKHVGKKTLALNFEEVKKIES
jgi:hypothetical protein